MVRWISSIERKPSANVAFLMRLDGEIYYAWKRASDFQYEIRGYYIEKVLPKDTEFEWCQLRDLDN